MLELEIEMAGLQAGVAAAESRAALLESTAATAKDQLLRLTADFDNFRRRTVSAEGGGGWSGDVLQGGGGGEQEGGGKGAVMCCKREGGLRRPKARVADTQ